MILHGMIVTPPFQEIQPKLNATYQLAGFMPNRVDSLVWAHEVMRNKMEA